MLLCRANQELAGLSKQEEAAESGRPGSGLKLPVERRQTRRRQSKPVSLAQQSKSSSSDAREDEKHDDAGALEILRDKNRHAYWPLPSANQTEVRHELAPTMSEMSSAAEMQGLQPFMQVQPNLTPAYVHGTDADSGRDCSRIRARLAVPSSNVGGNEMFLEDTVLCCWIRRAQQKCRERQRHKLAQSEAHTRELERSLQRLKVEKSALEARAVLLERLLNTQRDDRPPLVPQLPGSECGFGQGVCTCHDCTLTIGSTKMDGEGLIQPLLSGLIGGSSPKIIRVESLMSYCHLFPCE